MTSVQQIPRRGKWPPVWAPDWIGGCLFGAAGLGLGSLDHGYGNAEQRLALGLVLVTSLLGSGLLLMFRPVLGRLCATLWVLAGAGLSLRRVSEQPSFVLAGATVTTGLLFLLWFAASLGAPSAAGPGERATARLRGALVGAFGAWLVTMLTAGTRSSALNAGLAVCVASCGALGMLVAAGQLRAPPQPERARSRRPGGARTWLGLTAGALCFSIGALGTRYEAVDEWLPLALGAQWLVLPSRRGHADNGPAWWDVFTSHPQRLFVGTFLGLCAAGTVLLGLPMSAASGSAISLLDALFTSVSAVCVTGLIVLDTPVAFSGFGQVVLLLLIQLGGLGIIAFSTVAAALLGRRMGLRQEAIAANMLSADGRGTLSGTAARALIFTFAVEAFGAVLLTGAFIADGDAWPTALFRGIFTAVSAFCNAGFALQSDSLIGYQTDPVVLHVIATLIICGGLSPAVVVAAPALIGRRWRKVSLEMKLSLTTTLVLLVGGFGFVAAAEWNASLAHLSFLDRLHNSWFQSVTLRTAGFNSVDFGLLHPATITFMMAMMFIGGSPGGTAGGVKTTTVAVLAVSAFETVRGKRVVDVFGRRLSDRTQKRTLAVMTLATATLLTAIVFMLLTQRIDPGQSAFEVVSALGTVGLSLGATAQLDGFGKLLIAACMFVGRVGGLTFFMFLSQRDRRVSADLPEEDVPVG